MKLSHAVLGWKRGGFPDCPGNFPGAIAACTIFTWSIQPSASWWVSGLEDFALHAGHISCMMHQWQGKELSPSQHTGCWEAGHD